jgi:hypothetical protein
VACQLFNRHVVVVLFVVADTAAVAGVRVDTVFTVDFFGNVFGAEAL